MESTSSAGRGRLGFLVKRARPRLGPTPSREFDGGKNLVVVVELVRGAARHRRGEGPIIDLLLPRLGRDVALRRRCWRRHRGVVLVGRRRRAGATGGRGGGAAAGRADAGLRGLPLPARRAPGAARAGPRAGRRREHARERDATPTACERGRERRYGMRGEREAGRTDRGGPKTSAQDVATVFETCASDEHGI